MHLTTKPSHISDSQLADHGEKMTYKYVSLVN